MMTCILQNANLIETVDIVSNVFFESKTPLVCHMALALEVKIIPTDLLRMIAFGHVEVFFYIVDQSQCKV